MSENVDLARSIFAAWGRGDFGSAGWAHHEIELVAVDGPEPGSWSGLAGMADAWRDFLRAWDAWRVEAEQYREIDQERVLVLGHYSGRGRTSGFELGEIGTRGALLLHFRDGKVTRIVIYWDRQRAFADLGLEE
jgi:ketosteroid isomerase-like protein